MLESDSENRVMEFRLEEATRMVLVQIKRPLWGNSDAEHMQDGHELADFLWKEASWKTVVHMVVRLVQTMGGVDALMLEMGKDV